MENTTNNTNTENTQEDSSELNIVEAKIGEHQKKRRSSKKSKRKSHRKHRSSYKNNGKKKMKLWKKLLIAFGCIVLSLALLTAGAFVYLRNSGKDQLSLSSYTITAPDNPDVVLDDGGNTVKYNGKTYKYKKDVVNILFMGVDRERDEEIRTEIGNKYNADVIIVMSIDTKTNEVKLVNVPRDIVTDVSVYSKTGGYTGTEKLPIAMSYAYGGTEQECCMNCLDSVRRIFYNIPINAYFSMEIDGISVINDEVGGIDVKSPEDVYRGEELVFKKGEKYHLEGEMANDFVRLRNKKTADANLLRNERQKLYLTELMKKVISHSKSDITAPVKLYRAAEDYSCTNIKINGVTYLASELVGKGNITTDTETIPVDVKQVKNRAENYIREDEFYEKFLGVFYDEVS